MIGISVIFPSKPAPKPPHRAAFFYYLRSTQEPQVLAFCSSSLVLIVCSSFGEHTATNWEGGVWYYRHGALKKRKHFTLKIVFLFVVLM